MRVITWWLTMMLLAGCRQVAPRTEAPDASTPSRGTDLGGPRPTKFVSPPPGAAPTWIRDGGHAFDAGAEVDAGFDAGFDAGTELDAGPTSTMLLYTADRTQSPIDDAVALRLRAIAARGTGRGTVFSKVGDSISTNGPGIAGGNFLNCFDGPIEGTVSWETNVRLGSYSALAPTIMHFRTTLIGSDDSWTRPSLATRVSMTARWPITGTPTPLEQELAAANPRYAVVMYGSNDIGYVGAPYTLAEGAEYFENNMRTITDRLIAAGVIPLLTTMPPDAAAFRLVPVYAGVVRGIAQGRQIPLIDYNRELLALGPPYGLASDGTHPTCAAYNTCCWFDAVSLSRHGYNVRNLITLQALDRMHQVFELGVARLDAFAPHMTGDGSMNAPYVIPQLPFGELRDLRTSTWRPAEPLSCAGAPAVVGPQNLYRLVLNRTTSLRVVLVDGITRQQRISLLSGPTLSSCLQSASRIIATTLPAGTYYLSVNAPAATGGSEYNLSVTECLPGDPDC
ncbi:MAG: GDSL-type esterase/lipase family protein [Archangium sp.]|nr:GDSL-type esterase/lipase family protein [Archangium sp.]MDP3574690.1 GDSL-type esterase/lipase family protein [Archangium sp.]